MVSSKSPSTDANDNCQPASTKDVGLISRRIIAANDNVLRGFERRRKKNDRQKTQHIMAALIVGALGGTISKKIPITIIQIVARARFIRPASLHNHQTTPIKMPRCIPERLIKCSRPVLRKALYVVLSIFPLYPSNRASSRPRFLSSGDKSPSKPVVAVCLSFLFTFVRISAEPLSRNLMPSADLTEAAMKTFLRARYRATLNWPGLVGSLNLSSQQYI